MTEDLKASHLVIDGEHIMEIPSRKDSYDRLLEMDKQFPDVEKSSPEDTATKSKIIKKLEAALHELTDKELSLIQEIFYLERTERAITKMQNVAASTIHSRKMAILRKLKKIFKNLRTRRDFNGKVIEGVLCSFCSLTIS